MVACVECNKCCAGQPGKNFLKEEGSTKMLLDFTIPIAASLNVFVMQSALIICEKTKWFLF